MIGIVSNKLMPSKLLKVFVIGCALFLLSFSNQLNAGSLSELIMITDDKCIFCRAWEKEIGNVYSKTNVAKHFPLKKIQFYDLDEKFNRQYSNIWGTPIFIFVMDGEEVGRVEGYTDAEIFWWLVEDVMISVGLSSE